MLNGLLGVRGTLLLNLFILGSVDFLRELLISESLLLPFGDCIVLLFLVTIGVFLTEGVLEVLIGWSLILEFFFLFLN